MQVGGLPLVTSVNLPSSLQGGQPSRNPEDWHVVLRSYQGVIVRYHRGQRALAVESRNPLGLTSPRHHSPPLPASEGSHSRDNLCPFCKRPLHEQHSNSTSGRGSNSHSNSGLDHAFYNADLPRLPPGTGPGHLSTDYFHLLSEAHENSLDYATPEPSRPSTPVPPEISHGLDDSAFSEGYYHRFFNEISLLGRGMTGSVWLCQHVLNGNPIGLFACKKIPVGNNSRSLVKALKEITQLESLRHPNIVSVHHVWLETAAPALGPPVPCLFALMDYAHDGSLDKYIRSRGGLRDFATDSDESVEALKRKARLRRHSRHQGVSDNARPIHLLSEEEILSLFGDIVSGLAFLHDHNMLHLDIKAENILLHRLEGDEELLPTAMLSDFGSAEARNAISRHQRTGTTGTLDYLAPESLLLSTDGRPRQHTASLDLWALGLVLHLLIFFRLPYNQIEDVDELTEEIKAYPGFDRRQSPHARRDLPSDFLHLLESLININPFERPSAKEVLSRVRQIRAEGKSQRRTAKRKQTESPVSEALVARQPSPPILDRRSPTEVKALTQIEESHIEAPSIQLEDRGRVTQVQAIIVLACPFRSLKY